MSVASHQREPAKHVRFDSKADKRADVALSPLSANRDLMHRSKQPPYSLTLSARASSIDGTSRPSALAVSDLGFQRSPRLEQSDQDAPDQSAKIAHREGVSADSRSRSAVLCLR